MPSLLVEKTGSNDFNPCKCCGNMTRALWGFVHNQERTVAAYFVSWVLNEVQKHGASFDLILGEWGENSSSKDRTNVSLRFRKIDGKSQLMIIDSKNSPKKEKLADKFLARQEVFDQKIDREVFKIVDEILIQDERLSELLR